ncbi:protein DEK isoform X1 [Puntigrus tetrazona]|uniref:protein DEK isoform X1 n=1 Tax=Puntigrus tetrazona TaxID=1606681 RepID=UPI001C8A832E|nr:protein DEK isoform X1 [Puntigrus tetrazona]XP_043117823.1 protein DEK isoform X1 [Puntigrus tetrazona]XP_043117824.1 protein DEK isoform X1 [Puntigrus tetrazona]
MEAVKTEDLPLDGKPVKKGEEDDKKKKKSPSDDTEQDESEEPKPKSRSKPKLFEPEILEGKREKKIIQRLDLMSKPKEKPKIESIGEGAKLGDIVRINHSIGKLKAPLLKPLHKIVYDRPGTASTLRKNLRLFNGFPFGEESDLYNKKMEKVKRLHKEQLKTICQTLDLERSGTQIVLSERIMKFLVHPTNSGKPILKKKKKTTKDAKREKSSSKSKKTQKKVESGKSKPIVTDSSSDDDDDDDDEEGKENNKDAEKSVTAIKKNKDTGDKSCDKEEDDEDEEDDDEEDDEDEEDEDAPEEESKKEEQKTSQKKSANMKSTKKSEKSEQTASDESDQDVHEDKNAKKTKKPAAKRKASAKPVPKTKKADSSSNRGKKKASKSKDESESSDDDDQPLIKMIKKPPTEEQLKEAIKDLLKDANLEEVTMKQITRQVYDKYPDFDLTSRKEFIKETVKGLLS